MPLYTITDLKDKLKRYFMFSREEIKNFIIIILILAFIVSFKDWGAKEFELLVGLRNLFNAVLIVTLAVLAHASAQRIAGLQVGIRVEHRLWWAGLLMGLVLIFVSRGNLWFLAPGGVIFHHMAVHRIGFFRYGINTLTMSSVALAGPLANVAFAILFKILFVLLPNNVLIEKAILVNVWFAVFNMLPIPPLDGNYVFFYSRGLYFLLFGAILGAALLLVLKINILVAIFGSLLFGLLFGVYYAKVLEGVF
ncbi:hypothetical protein CMO89_01210 [Candidatus Woesearchaeota archaeon]|nr:hypothetical protein [Candidatus Woesearchaeota archaeon]|tara:strand:+ start:593 stop:1345 length:753 start_codon:yes stop_codon:yes gene_type:complete